MVDHVEINDGDKTGNQADAEGRSSLEKRQGHDWLVRNTQFNIDEQEEKQNSSGEGGEITGSMASSVDGRRRRQVLKGGSNLLMTSINISARGPVTRPIDSWSHSRLTENKRAAAPPKSTPVSQSLKLRFSTRLDAGSSQIPKTIRIHAGGT